MFRNESDLYLRCLFPVSEFSFSPFVVKKLENEYEYLALEEGYLRDEIRYLKRELVRAQQEVRFLHIKPSIILSPFCFCYILLLKS